MECKEISLTAKQLENVKRINQLALPNIHHVLSVLKEHTKSLDKNMRDRLEDIVGTIRKNRKIDLENLQTALEFCKELGAGDMNMKKNEKNLKRTRLCIKSQLGSEMNDNCCKQIAESHLFESIPTQTEVPSPDDINYGENYNKGKADSALISHQINVKEIKTIPNSVITKQKNFMKCDSIDSSLQINNEIKSDSESVLKDVLSDEILKEDPNMKNYSDLNLKVIYNVGSSLDSRNTPDSINTLDYVVSSEDGTLFKESKNKKLPKTITGLIINYYAILLESMVRNLKLYNLFSRHIMKPILHEEFSCLIGAYDCWKDYLTYADVIVQILQPYILELLVLYPKNMRYELKHGIIGGQMPTVLVDAVKNMKVWRAALEDTLLCTMGLGIKEKRIIGNQIEWNIMYKSGLNGVN